MSGLSGLEVARAVVQIRADLPVLLVSGYLSPTAEAVARAVGIKAIVEKPSMLQQLGGVVARLPRHAARRIDLHGLTQILPSAPM